MKSRSTFTKGMTALLSAAMVISTMASPILATEMPPEELEMEVSAAAEQPAETPVIETYEEPAEEVVSEVAQESLADACVETETAAETPDEIAEPETNTSVAAEDQSLIDSVLIEKAATVENENPDKTEDPNEVENQDEEELEEEEEDLEKKEGCAVQLFGDEASYMNATADIVASNPATYTDTLTVDLQNEVIVESNGNVFEGGDYVMEQAIAATNSPAEAAPIMESAGYDVLGSAGTSIAIEDPYMLHRLYVETDMIDDTVGAVQAIGYNGEFFLQYENSEDTIAAYETFRQDDTVRAVYADMPIHASELSEDDLNYEASFYSGLDGMSYSNGVVQMGLDAFQKNLADKDAQPENVIVAVLDSGVNASNEFLAGRIMNGYNFVDKNADTSDVFNHGTSVAGIICDATPNNVTILPVKVLDSNGDGSTSTVRLGLNYAMEAGAEVINLSMDAEDVTRTKDPLNEAFAGVLNKGGVICVAAGNGAGDVMDHYPARSAQVITVGALDASMSNIAQFSNYGDAIDFAMPGSDIMATAENSFTTKSGTSIAAPHIAAAAAIIKSLNKTLDQNGVMAQLVALAEDMGAEGKDPYYGYGFVNFSNVKPEDLCVHAFVDSNQETGNYNVYTSRCSKCGLEISESLSVEKASYAVSVNKTIPIGHDETLLDGVTLQWSSDNENIATVDDSGNVTGVAEGTANITVRSSDGHVSRTCTVNVVSANTILIESISTSETYYPLDIEDSMQIPITIAPENATNKALTWTSDTPDVVTVDQNGVVTPTGQTTGAAQVTVSATDGSGVSTEVAIWVGRFIREIQLSKQATTLKVGEKETISAKILPERAAFTSIMWSSDDLNIAQVDVMTGEITAEAPGTTTIKAMAMDGLGVFSSCEVTVEPNDVKATGISVNRVKASVTEGQTLQINATVTPSDTTNKAVTWKSSNESVATVNSVGKVFTKKPGTATITATTADGSNKSATCIVTVNPKVVISTGITLNKTSTTVTEGATDQLTATVAPTTATNRNATWSSSNEKIVTVDKNGKITGKAVGTATITATTADGSGKTATCKVTVTKRVIPATKIALNKSNVTMMTGKTEQLTATFTPSNATNKNITWTSSDNKVATVDKNGKITAKTVGTVKIIATPADKNAAAAFCAVTVNKYVPTSVAYRTHVQTYGWQKYVTDGALSGTTGESKRLEGININLEKLEYPGEIEYRTHVQTYGWQDWKKNGQMAGTQGESKRLEAIQIRLTGEMAKYYDVYYQTHVQHFGWSGWAKNGEMCGSAGYAYRLEGIRIRLVKKGEKAPGSSAEIFHEKNNVPTNGSEYYKGTSVKYNTHVQTYGWQNYVVDGAMAGTTGQSKRLEGIHIELTDVKYAGDIEYRTHVQTYGWQSWKKNGQMAGTSGESKRLEAIQIRLTGDMAKQYDVYYQTHVQTFGWSGWAKNGEMCGSAGYAKRLEGIKIVLVKKGGKAPGSTANAFHQK